MSSMMHWCCCVATCIEAGDVEDACKDLMLCIVACGIGACAARGSRELWGGDVQMHHRMVLGSHWVAAALDVLLTLGLFGAGAIKASKAGQCGSRSQQHGSSPKPGHIARWQHGKSQTSRCWMVSADICWGVQPGAAPHMTSDDIVLSDCFLAAISRTLEGRHC